MTCWANWRGKVRAIGRSAVMIDCSGRGPRRPPIPAVHRNSRPHLLLLTTCMLLSLLSGACAGGGLQKPAPVQGYRVVNAYPHDPHAYTQGLIFHEGFLIESTGLNGFSTLRRVRLESGDVIRQQRLDPAYFAEGLAEWEGRLVQLTWRSRTAFVYDSATFAPRGTFRYTGEGWGLTRGPQGFIMSDGTDTLRVIDPGTFRETRRLRVTDGGSPVTHLNELEYVRGEVYANVLGSDRIARISPESGRVVGWIDLSGLLPPSERPDSEAVLNGIAYDAAGDRLFVTGKLWPRLFEIQATPSE